MCGYFWCKICVNTDINRFYSEKIFYEKSLLQKCLYLFKIAFNLCPKQNIVIWQSYDNWFRFRGSIAKIQGQTLSNRDNWFCCNSFYGTFMLFAIIFAFKCVSVGPVRVCVVHSLSNLHIPYLLFAYDDSTTKLGLLTRLQHANFHLMFVVSFNWGFVQIMYESFNYSGFIVLWCSLLKTKRYYNCQGNT